MKIKNNIKGYILRLLTRKKSADFDIKKSKSILFLRYDRIGDMVITTPIFRELKALYPYINIIVLASKLNKGVLLNNPNINEIYTCNKNNILSDIFLLIKLRRKKIDVCVEFDHSVIPHAILRLIAIKPKKIISVAKFGRYGVNKNELGLYDIFTEKTKGQHLSDIWLNTIRPFGVIPKSNKYDLYITDKQELLAKKFLKKYPNKSLIGINLEGAVKGKKIEFSKFKEILRGIYQIKNDIQVIILSSPERFQFFNKKIEEMSLEYVISSYQTNTILDVAALIKELDLVITPDTSIVHIASAFDIPLVSIHEDNKDSYSLFAPKSKNNRTVFSKFPDRLEGYNVGKIIENSVELLKKNEG